MPQSNNATTIFVITKHNQHYHVLPFLGNIRNMIIAKQNRMALPVLIMQPVLGYKGTRLTRQLHTEISPLNFFIHLLLQILTTAYTQCIIQSLYLDLAIVYSWKRVICPDVRSSVVSCITYIRTSARDRADQLSMLRSISLWKDKHYRLCTEESEWTNTQETFYLQHIS